MEDLAPEDAVEEWSDLSASNLVPGTRLGRYELLQAIAYGGMARVWAARQRGQRGFSKLVAIKTILPHLAHNPAFERMFLDEARIAAGVHHPNVIEIYELGEEGRVLYLAMEWVNGDSLSRLLRGQGTVAVQIEPRIAARIIADACAGLHAAHELTDDDGHLLDVVHRDVTPHNVLVSLEGTVKVTDFGVAKALGQIHDETAAGEIKGKVAYMAPEQIGGNRFDRRADIFGMGCVLYEAVTGVRPFRGDGDPQVMQAVLRGTYDPPAMRCEGLSPDLSAIIDRALAFEPQVRFATAENMRVALEEWLAKGGPVVTATQVGAIVRERLGPMLDKRREQVKVATAQAPLAEPGSATPARVSASDIGHTPSRPQAGQSQSGIVRTIAEGLVAAPAPAVPTAPAPASSNYLLAAIAGVIFALVAGSIVLAIVLSMRSRLGAATAITGPVATVATPPPTVSAAILATAAPAATAATGTASGAPAASVSTPTPAASVSASAPRTVNISDLPVAPAAKPNWPSAPMPPARPTAAPAAPAPTRPALPANPY